MAETDVRSQLSSWCRSDDHGGCKMVQARCACSCHGVNGQEPPVNRPSVVQASPLAARLRQEADQIAERREAVAVLEAPRGPVPGKRREWSEEDKARIVAEAGRDGGRVVMARYQLAGSVLNRWIREARAARKTTPTPIVPNADRSEPTPEDPFAGMETCPSCHRAVGTAEVHLCAREATTPDDALGAAIGHLRWHRDHLAAKLAKIDAALAALEELGGEAS